jgi:hypothetical protein
MTSEAESATSSSSYTMPTKYAKLDEWDGIAELLRQSENFDKRNKKTESRYNYTLLTPSGHAGGRRHLLQEPEDLSEHSELSSFSDIAADDDDDDAATGSSPKVSEDTEICETSSSSLLGSLGSGSEEDCFDASGIRRSRRLRQQNKRRNRRRLRKLKATRKRKRNGRGCKCDLHEEFFKCTYCPSVGCTDCTWYGYDDAKDKLANAKRPLRSVIVKTAPVLEFS